MDNFLQNTPLILGDGAMGSRLIDQGWDLEESCERWNLEKPEAILAIHQSYVEAGSDFIMTNTFGGCPLRLKEDDLDDQTEEINQTAAQLARQAAGDFCYVLGDIGPCGFPLEPVGPAKAGDVKAQFKRQVRGLLEGVVDGFIIETMMDLVELRCAVEAVQELSSLPILASLCFQEKDENYQTLNGVSAKEAAKEMEAMGVHAIGSNCMMGISSYPHLMREMRESTSLPLLAQPNAGQPVTQDDKLVYEDTPEMMMQHIPALIDSGVKIIGGCCGTTPEFIRLLRQWADQHK